MSVIYSKAKCALCSGEYRNRQISTTSIAYFTGFCVSCDNHHDRMIYPWLATFDTSWEKCCEEVNPHFVKKKWFKFW